jgi:hypothetical protein
LSKLARGLLVDFYVCKERERAAGYCRYSVENTKSIYNTILYKIIVRIRCDAFLTDGIGSLDRNVGCIQSSGVAMPPN